MFTQLALHFNTNPQLDDDQGFEQISTLKCPFDSSHIMMPKNFLTHIYRCKSPNKMLYVQCKYDPCHWIYPQEKDKHHQDCPTRLEHYKDMDLSQADWDQACVQKMIEAKNPRKQHERRKKKVKLILKYLKQGKLHLSQLQSSASESVIKNKSSSSSTKNDTYYQIDSSTPYRDIKAKLREMINEKRILSGDQQESEASFVQNYDYAYDQQQSFRGQQFGGYENFLNRELLNNAEGFGPHSQFRFSNQQFSPVGRQSNFPRMYNNQQNHAGLMGLNFQFQTQLMGPPQPQTFSLPNGFAPYTNYIRPYQNNQPYPYIAPLAPFIQTPMYQVSPVYPLPQTSFGTSNLSTEMRPRPQPQKSLKLEATSNTEDFIKRNIIDKEGNQQSSNTNDANTLLSCLQTKHTQDASSEYSDRQNSGTVLHPNSNPKRIYQLNESNFNEKQKSFQKNQFQNYSQSHFSRQNEQPKQSENSKSKKNPHDKPQEKEKKQKKEKEKRKRKSSQKQESSFDKRSHDKNGKKNKKKDKKKQLQSHDDLQYDAKDQQRILKKQQSLPKNENMSKTPNIITNFKQDSSFILQKQHEFFQEQQQQAFPQSSTPKPSQILIPYRTFQTCHENPQRIYQSQKNKVTPEFVPLLDHSISSYDFGPFHVNNSSSLGNMTIQKESSFRFIAGGDNNHGSQNQDRSQFMEMKEMLSMLGSASSRQINSHWNNNQQYNGKIYPNTQFKRNNQWQKDR